MTLSVIYVILTSSLCFNSDRKEQKQGNSQVKNTSIPKNSINSIRALNRKLIKAKISSDNKNSTSNKTPQMKRNKMSISKNSTEAILVLNRKLIRSKKPSYKKNSTSIKTIEMKRNNILTIKSIPVLSINLR